MDTFNTVLDSSSLENQDVDAYGYAGFWERFAAGLVDGLIVGVAMLPIQWLSTYMNTGAYFILGLGTIARWVYSAVQQSGEKQATIGQNLLNIKLVSLDGNEITFLQATGRHFAKYLSILLFMAGYFMFFFTEKKQCLHDLLAGTIVVKHY